MTFQSQASAVRAEIRRISRQAERTARARAAHCHGSYEHSLAGVLDHWIAREHGPNRLVIVACASELGVLQAHHLELGHASCAQSHDRALRALYWAVVRRWAREPEARMSDASRATRNTGAVAPADPCVDCRELAGENRRFAPHRHLEFHGAPLLRADAVPPASVFECRACHTHWVRRSGPFELFAAWSMVDRGAVSG